MIPGASNDLQATAAQRALILLTLLAAGALTLLTLRPPAHVGSDSGFVTANAVEHLEFIAREPRPVGSPHHRAVREYLVEQFRSLGLDVQVQDATVRHPRFLNRLPVQVLNVAARLPGRAAAAKDDGNAPRRAVMLTAHYDSTRASAAPGAGDDAAAVAALLEVARILAADPPANDVIFLITDAEELGLFGARAFVEEHPWREDVGVVFNFEARGTSGPSIMFETSDAQAFLVEQYARIAPHPITSSLSDDIYRLMPNSTDFTIFRAAGMQGMNFAFVGGYANYHTPGDTIENLDIRSMRHHGVQALTLARHFGELDLAARWRTSEAVYFNLTPLLVVRYPAQWALVVATAAALAALLVLIRLAERGHVYLLGMLRGAAALVLCIALAAAGAWVLLHYLPPSRLADRAEWAIAGFACLSLLAVTIVAWIFGRRESTLNFAATGLVVFVILALLSAGYVRGGSYLAGWPTLFLGIGLLCAARVQSHPQAGWPAVIGMTLAALPLVLLVTPVMYLSFLGLRLHMAPVMCPVMVLVLWPLIPQLRIVSPRGWLIPLLSLGAGAGCFAAAVR